MEIENEIKDIDNLDKEINGENQESNIDDNSTNSIVVTQTQQEIMKEIAKIDVELEQLDSTQINDDEFYDSLDETLTDEEKYLQEENPKEFLKLVDKKKREYIASKSNESKKNDLLEKKKDLELKNAIEDGLLQVTKMYKDYNHEEMQTFFSKKLNQEEKDEILNTSKSTFEVFRKTHEKYLEKNGKNKDIKNTPPPNTPDLKNVIKQPIKGEQINNINSEEERYKKALGV